MKLECHDWNYVIRLHSTFGDLLTYLQHLLSPIRGTHDSPEMNMKAYYEAFLLNVESLNN